LKQFSSSFSWALLCLIISAILLTLPGSALPKEDWLDRIWFDKFVHIILFFVLVILWCHYGVEKFEVIGLRKQFFLWVAIIALLYGTGMEFVQRYFIKNRSFDIGDVVADAVGCGMGLIYSLRKYIKK
jgi:VanZ family protein